MTDRKWQRAIVERDDICQIGQLLGKNCMVVPTTGHHIIHRRYKKTRHDLRNGIGLCPVCHNWAHSNPEESRKKIIDVLIDNGVIENIEEFEAMELMARR